MAAKEAWRPTRVSMSGKREGLLGTSELPGVLWSGRLLDDASDQYRRPASHWPLPKRCHGKSPRRWRPRREKEVGWFWWDARWGNVRRGITSCHTTERRRPRHGPSRGTEGKTLRKNRNDEDSRWIKSPARESPRERDAYSKLTYRSRRFSFYLSNDDLWLYGAQDTAQAILSVYCHRALSLFVFFGLSSRRLTLLFFW